MSTQNPTFERHRRIGQAICRYFMEAPIPFTPSRQDYQQWLDTLAMDEKMYFNALGFEACTAVNAFKRHWYEKQHYRLRNYLQRHLSSEDFKIYCQMPAISQLRANLLSVPGDSRLIRPAT